MYSKELEAIIEAVLADGLLTNKEREVLHRRAAQEGVDADELDVVIESKLAKMKQEKEAVHLTHQASDKRGNVVKCPNCGTPVQAGAVKCSECDYVFTNVQANSLMVRFQKGLDEIREKYNLKIENASEKKNEKYYLGLQMKEEMRQFIKNFLIPSSKEDLIEFTAVMDGNRRNSNEFEDAYRAKYQECILKIKTLFHDDPQMMELVKSTDTKWGRMSSGTKTTIFIILLFIALFIIILING